MFSAHQRSSLKLIALVLLAAMVMGGAWVGFYTGGSASSRGASSNDQDGAAALAAAAAQKAGLKSRLDRFLHAGDAHALDDLLPKGITEISGQGGRGLNRQIRSHGLWFPVFDLSQLANPDDPESGSIRLNDIPLMIVTPHPPVGRVKEWLSHRFSAVGGQPPYSWTVQAEGESPEFTLNAQTGDFGTQSDVPVNAALSVYVTDAAGAQASAATTLVIGSAEPLTIATLELPAGNPGETYSTQLAATGGAQPYVWSVTGAPDGWSCDATTGVITGRFTEPGEHELRVVLSDQVTQVERRFRVVASGSLDITTESPLPPAAPGAFYSGLFEASGGVEPYRWSVIAGDLPPGWTLLEDGTMSGNASDVESRHEFQVQVMDAMNLTFQKSFQVSVSKGLLVIASREKAGLAWQYEAMAAALGVPCSGVILKRDGREIYRGQGTNVVDRGLMTGVTYSYELSAVSGGRLIPYAAAVAAILPMTKQRAQPGVTGDPYADRVTSFAPLSPGGFGSANVPSNVTGPPDGASTFNPAYLPNHLLSLHATNQAGGRVVLEFTDNIIEAGSGPDFTVFENVFFKNNDPNQRFMEPAVVEVALFEGQWHRFPCRVSPGANGLVDLYLPSYYAQGFAGVNATTGDDPTDPSRSGGDSFDLGNLGRADLQWFRFVRLTATGDAVLMDNAGKPVRHTDENNSLNGRGSSGFDLDAVSAVNY